MKPRKKRTYERKSGGQHRIVPVLKEAFDKQEFARILLLLAMHIDETNPVSHNKSNKPNDGGDNRE